MRHRRALRSALLFRSESFTTETARLYGRHVVNEGFFGAWIERATGDALVCVASAEEELQAFRRRVAAQAGPGRKTVWVTTEDPRGLATQAEVLHRPDPWLADLAWLRRFASPRAYSLTGIAHAVSGAVVERALGEILLGPLEAWDALVCTSRAQKAAIDDIWESYAGYLRTTTGARVAPRLQTPIIPLGIDTASFAPADRARRRARVRRRLEIPADDLVVLWRGRLNFYDKAHPLPMYLALEKAVRRTGRRVHLVQSGWFEDDDERREFAEAAAAFPAFRTVTIGREDLALERDVWYGADLFLSLIDNIQENFGLALVEAMAAGLPSIAADWDGYRDILRDQVDGVLVPTWLPSPGAGDEFARLLLADPRNGPTTGGCVAMTTAADVEACAAALVALFEDPPRRRRLGEAARERARHVFDWSVVYGQYETLWRDLAALRRRAPLAVPVRPGPPVALVGRDPYARFAGHATAALRPKTRLVLGGQASQGALARLFKLGMATFGQETRLPLAELRRIIGQVAAGPTTVRDVIATRAPATPALVMRSIGQLLKLDVLAVARRFGQAP